MEMMGRLIKMKSGRWVVECYQWMYPFYYRHLFPVHPDQEVIEEAVFEWDNIVGFSPRYLNNELYAYLYEDDCY
jgi:hypothetical protein